MYNLLLFINEIKTCRVKNQIKGNKYARDESSSVIFSVAVINLLHLNSVVQSSENNLHMLELSVE